MSLYNACKRYILPNYGFAASWSEKMIRKTSILLLIFLAGTLLAPAASAADANSFRPGRDLQPSALEEVGIRAVQALDPNLTGKGIRYALICRSMTYDQGHPRGDYRPRVSHQSLDGAKIDFAAQSHDPNSISSHSTAIGSILFGKAHGAYHPALGEFDFRGAVPDAQTTVFEFWDFLTNHVFTNSPPDANVIVAAIGTQFPAWWTRGMQAMAEQSPAVIVASIGNGTEVPDPVLYPAAGSNVIGVGVVDSVAVEQLAARLNNFSLARPCHSSTGPTLGGRAKPDIVAPGNYLAADVESNKTYSPTGDWSSFSAPVTAGAIGILMQRAKTDPAISQAVFSRNGNCLIKSILINSAAKLPFWHKGRLEKTDDHTAPLDYVQGGGMLNTRRAYEHLTAGPAEPGNVADIGWDLNRLGEPNTPHGIYLFNVDQPKGKTITATLNWNRHFETSYPFNASKNADNNLQLQLWAIAPENPDRDYLLDYSDSPVDNVEHIHCLADANYTRYELAVSYSSEQHWSERSEQTYALSWNIDKMPVRKDISWYDLNSDGVVDEADILILIENWLQSVNSPDSYVFGDYDSNGRIEAADVGKLLDEQGRKTDRF